TPAPPARSRPATSCPSSAATHRSITVSPRPPAAPMRLAAWRPVRGTVGASTGDPGDRAALDPGIPDDLDRRPDVLVVGGGVIGLATAVFCRRAGVGRGPGIGAGRPGAGACGA